MDWLIDCAFATAFCCYPATRLVVIAILFNLNCIQSVETPRNTERATMMIDLVVCLLASLLELIGLVK